MEGRMVRDGDQDLQAPSAPPGPVVRGRESSMRGSSREAAFSPRARFPLSKNIKQIFREVEALPVLQLTGPEFQRAQWKVSKVGRERNGPN